MKSRNRMKVASHLDRGHEAPIKTQICSKFRGVFSNFQSFESRLPPNEPLAIRPEMSWTWDGLWENTRRHLASSCKSAILEPRDDFCLECRVCLLTVTCDNPQLTVSGVHYVRDLAISASTSASGRLAKYSRIVNAGSGLPKSGVHISAH